ncbi:MAG: hypothetical protein ACFFED_07665 [Candidatus Thorarchaeota archaeon]
MIWSPSEKGDAIPFHVCFENRHCLEIKIEEIRKDLASEGLSPKKVVILVLYAIALAMGVVTIILPLVGQPVDQSLAGVALASLGIAGLSQITD